jgi:hypothetical protein
VQFLFTLQMAVELPVTLRVLRDSCGGSLPVGPTPRVRDERVT